MPAIVIKYQKRTSDPIPEQSNLILVTIITWLMLTKLFQETQMLPGAIRGKK